MSDPLVVCAGCHRHVRAAERACPFCGASPGAPTTASRPGALHTAVIAAALGLAAADRAHAQLNPPGSPRFDMVHGGAQGYGAPPSPTPLTGLPTTPAVAPTPAPAVFELARQPLRPDGRRSHAPWSVDIRIDADGAWTAHGRSGRLSPTQLAELRAAIERTSLSVSQGSPFGATSEAGETGQRFQTRRVTLGSRSVSWSELVPDDSIDRLIALARRLTRRRP